ncbi:hypothetical protein ACVGXJ_08675, partial [Enterobacter hormaechei]
KHKKNNFFLIILIKTIYKPANVRKLLHICIRDRHHTVLSHAVDLNFMRVFAVVLVMVVRVFDNVTRVVAFKVAVRWMVVYLGSKG